MAGFVSILVCPQRAEALQAELNEKVEKLIHILAFVQSAMLVQVLALL